MRIGGSRFHYRKIPFHLGSSHDGTADPLEVQSIFLEDRVMVRIHQSEIQHVTILIIDQFGKIQVSLSR